MTSKSGSVRHRDRRKWRLRNPGSPRLRILTLEDAEAAAPIPSELDISVTLMEKARAVARSEWMLKRQNTREAAEVVRVELARAKKTLFSSDADTKAVHEALRRARGQHP